MNPTLIAGFDDIMTHIKNQGDQIKKLEEKNKEQQEKMTALYQENQKLKEEKEKLKEKADFFEKEFYHTLDCQVKDQEEYEKENKELKEEKEKLYYEKMVLHNRVCTEETANLLLRNKNKVSEDQINQHNEWFKEINILVGADEDEPAVVSVNDLVAEYKKLKEKIDEQYEFSYFKKMKDLQGENKKLKEQLNED